MLKFFFDQDGVVWSYDSTKDITTCGLGDYHIIEGDKIIFCQNDGEVIDSFKLYDYKLFDRII